MDNGLIQEKPKEQLVYYPKSNTFRKDLDNKATMRGFDAYVEGEKKNRLTRSIERLSRHTNLSEDELQRLKDSVTEEPMFGTEEGAEFKTLLTKAQKKQLGYFKKKRYNKKEAAYKAQLGTWEFENLSKLYEQEDRVYKRVFDKEVADINLEEEINQIDQDFLAQADNNFVADETENAKKDAQKIYDYGINKQIKAYSGEKYSVYNQHFRDPGYKALKDDKEDAEALKEGIKRCPIDRTIIVNRGVSNMRALVDMLGLQSDVPTKNLNDAEMEKVVKQSVAHIQKTQQEGKDIIFTDPGFVSTSYNPENFYADQQTGIEFVIKVKPGTPAVNISSMSKFEYEKEVLLNAGTKFRFLKMYYGGTEKVDGLDYRQKSCELARKKENRRHGKYFLKIYLETIPPEEDGVLKNS